MHRLLLRCSPNLDLVCSLCWSTLLHLPSIARRSGQVEVDMYCSDGTVEVLFRSDETILLLSNTPPNYLQRSSVTMNVSELPLSATLWRLRAVTLDFSIPLFSIAGSLYIITPILSRTDIQE